MWGGRRAKETEARTAAAKMLPALGRGIQKSAASPSGLAALLGALGSGTHSRYVDHPEELAEQSSIDDGNSILGLKPPTHALSLSGNERY